MDFSPQPPRKTPEGRNGVLCCIASPLIGLIGKCFLILNIVCIHNSVDKSSYPYCRTIKFSNSIYKK